MKSERESLTRAIGTIGLAAGIVNVMIGGGIFRVPALVAASLGAAAPVAYLICALAMALIVTCIAEAGKRVTLTGVRTPTSKPRWARTPGFSPASCC
jgi:amino acid transporter